MDIKNESGFPTGSLLYILRSIKKGTCKEIFKLEKDEDYIAFLIDFLKLCDLSIKQIQTVNRNTRQKKLDSVNDLKEAMIHSHMKKGSFNIDLESIIKDDMTGRIEACDDFLIDNCSVPKVEQEALDNFIEEINSLRNDIKEAEINEELKDIILVHLNSVYESILKYNLFGMEEVKDSVTRTIGTLCLMTNECKTETDKTVMKNVLALMSKFNTVFGFFKNAGGAVRIADTIIKLIQ